MVKEKKKERLTLHCRVKRFFTALEQRKKEKRAQKS